MPELQRLRSRHIVIMDMLIAGSKQSEIAKQLGMTQAGISNVVNSPLFKARLAERRAELNKELTQDYVSTVNQAKGLIEEAALKAAKRQADAVESENENVALRASQQILDRVFGKTDDHQGGIVQVNAEQLNLLQVALNESNEIRPTKQKSTLIDVNPVEDTK